MTMTWTDLIGAEVGVAAIVLALVLGFAVLAAAWRGGWLVRDITGAKDLERPALQRAPVPPWTMSLRDERAKARHRR
jgi:hypothetical protein